MQGPVERTTRSAWRRLLDVVRVEKGHEDYPGELGEYAYMLLQDGPERAGASFPALTRHLASCGRCRADLEILLRLLG